MAVVGALCPLSLQTLFSSNNAPIVSGQILLFDAGTSNPRSGFEDAGLQTAFPSPILTDGFGRIPAIFLGANAYKITLNDASGALLSTIDNLPGGVDPNAAVAAAAAAALAANAIGTGMILGAHTDDIFDGWLPCNGNTIGNASSSATARAAADTSALFVKLWNKDGSLSVSGGRGVSATADYSAGKTIALPDYRGRSLAGVDGMGAALAGILTTLTTPTPNVLGTKAGVEAISLSGAQLPAISPAITVVNAGSHTHTGATDSQGAHNHGGATDTQGSHSHTLPPQSYINNDSEGGGAGGPKNSNGASGLSTGTDGLHFHNISSDGAHVHAVTTVAAGDHTHTATIANLGAGASHGNVQPTILGYFHIKL